MLPITISNKSASCNPHCKVDPSISSDGEAKNFSLMVIQLPITLGKHQLNICANPSLVKSTWTNIVDYIRKLNFMYGTTTSLRDDCVRIVSSRMLEHEEITSG